MMVSLECHFGVGNGFGRSGDGRKDASCFEVGDEERSALVKRNVGSIVCLIWQNRLQVL